jgi:hypothetical protein
MVAHFSEFAKSADVCRSLGTALEKVESKGKRIKQMEKLGHHMSKKYSIK